MGVYGCVNKTLALGIPLIDSMYGDDPNVGLYSLPHLVWFPMQLVVGSSSAARLSAFVKSERERTDQIARVADNATSAAEAVPQPSRAEPDEK
jgi:sodium/bile acid cotransporter 7